MDEIRHRIHSLRQMVEEEVGEKQLEDLKKSSKKKTESMDTGSLLSFTFGRSQNINIFCKANFSSLTNHFTFRFHFISSYSCRMLRFPIVVFSYYETLRSNTYSPIETIHVSLFEMTATMHFYIWEINTLPNVYDLAYEWMENNRIHVFESVLPRKPDLSINRNTHKHPTCGQKTRTIVNLYFTTNYSSRANL